MIGTPEQLAIYNLERINRALISILEEKGIASFSDIKNRAKEQDAAQEKAENDFYRPARIKKLERRLYGDLKQDWTEEERAHLEAALARAKAGENFL